MDFGIFNFEIFIQNTAPALNVLHRKKVTFWLATLKRKYLHKTMQIGKGIINFQWLEDLAFKTLSRATYLANTLKIVGDHIFSDSAAFILSSLLPSFQLFHLFLFSGQLIHQTQIYRMKYNIKWFPHIASFMLTTLTFKINIFFQ